MSSRNIAQGLARSCLKTSAARSWPRPRALPRPFSSPHSSSSYHSAASAPSPLAPSAFGHRPFARTFHTTHVARHFGIDRPEPGTGIKVHFRDHKGNLIKTVEANEGDDLLSIAHEYDIDLEGAQSPVFVYCFPLNPAHAFIGACEASMACSTCHVILDPEVYDQLPEPEDDENDMLDMAFGLTDTSRLGCQVRVTKAFDGMNVTLPAATRNMFVDGKKPARH
ncbi:2Fe-2S ferredoxin-type domain-containing protein [Cubamyces menziesii]|nr:2Fe-2S ferredoxin-type domain-containing protein [Cubamyces menziesii]